MFETFKNDDLVTVKLSTGEELIGKVYNNSDDGLGVKNALVLMQGPQGVALGTLFSTADPQKPILLNKTLIISVADVNPKLVEQYNNVFSKIKTQPKPNIIV